MRLRAGPGGIRTWDEPELILSDGELRSGSTRVALAGLTYADAAAAVGLVAHPLDEVYHDGPHVSPQEEIVLDLDQVRVVESALALGDAALRSFSPASDPVLWPEHFDVAVTVEEVNYGVSPGDSFHERPYAYVGPHRRASGDFWNAPFGAALPLEEDADVATVAAFFAEGSREAARSAVAQ